MLTFGQFSGRRGQSRSIWPVFFAQVPLGPGPKWPGPKKLVQSAPKHLQTVENVDTKTASSPYILHCSSVLSSTGSRCRGCIQFSTVLKVFWGRLDQFFGPRSSGAWPQWHLCKKTGQIDLDWPLRPENWPKVSIDSRCLVSQNL